ncbi:zinc finger protein 408-like [Nothobranchius furzeri]|uniref:zinc finger protein 408-like n=1 Tax=Nothobranchius furzeri TaxID=105023 RepID=UPI002403E6DD|nr:zinc finger protein 408-like isoform X1 [Nothobranchius furzeri]XP_054591350.1 zinc finger protein 408-like isoform X1 [Nothobranchius furzeri]
MARHFPPVPSDVTYFLSSVLPRGFALGPSLLCEGSVGLWWVGHPLEAGTLLGKEGDTDWISKSYPTLMEMSANQEAPLQRAPWIKSSCMLLVQPISLGKRPLVF